MKLKGLRWIVLFLVVLLTVIGYVERISFSVLWPFMARDLYPDKTNQELKQILATISVFFLFASSFGYIITGKILDRIGVRLGFTFIVVISSLAMIAHVFAKGAFSLGFVRAVLGGTLSGVLPGAIKSNAEWFPAKERALGMGFISIGPAIAGIISIPLTGYLLLFFSWKTVFILIGLSGLIWFLPWLVLVKAPPKFHSLITDEERDYILGGNQKLKEGDEKNSASKASIIKLLSHKQVWGIIIVYAAIEPVWRLCIIWLPTYLVEVYSLDVKELVSYGWFPYVGALLGTLLGGILPRFLLDSWSLSKTRKVIINTGCLIMILALMALSLINFTTPLLAVLIMSLALFGFSMTVCNVQTLPADFFDAKVIGTLAGIVLFVSSVFSGIMTSIVPFLSQDGDYYKIFGLGVVLVIIAMVSFWFLCPKIEKGITGSRLES